jgi:hypothetical protein
MVNNSRQVSIRTRRKLSVEWCGIQHKGKDAMPSDSSKWLNRVEWGTPRASAIEWFE